MRAEGIQVYNNTDVEEFRGEDTVKEVVLSNGETIKVNSVFLDIGAKPAVNLVKEAGLHLLGRKSIVVDSFMCTSDSHIFAVGDCANKIDFFSGKESGKMLAFDAVQKMLQSIIGER